MMALLAPRLFDGAEMLHDRAVVYDGGRITSVVAPRLPRCRMA